jgi:drug/metabolite transporter (DMT)-like permease
LILPLGAKLFGEHINPKALVFALLAFGGVGLVLFSARRRVTPRVAATSSALLAMALWSPIRSRLPTSGATWTREGNTAAVAALSYRYET